MTSPISAGLWNGPERVSALELSGSIRCMHCGTPRHITSAPMRPTADYISMNSISILRGCRNFMGRRRRNDSSVLPSFKPSFSCCERLGSWTTMPLQPPSALCLIWPTANSSQRPTAERSQISNRKRSAHGSWNGLSSLRARLSNCMPPSRLWRKNAG